ncbi:MAG TPA: outer membrane beta-barrel protein [Flavitalea sp.]|nr:outer membrane beta-barrel protein [Flavitalea sp.]
MERRLHNDEFEDLLREKSDQFRMYPSDKVWKEINKSMHPRRKWYWLGMALLLSGLGYQYADQLISPSPIASSRPAANPELPKVDLSDIKQPAELIPFKASVDLKKDPQIPTIPPANTLNPSGASALSGTDVEEASLARIIAMDHTYDLDAGSDNFGQPVELFTSLDDLLATVDPLPDLAPKSEMQSVTDKEGIPTRINWLQEYALYELAVSKPNRWSFQVYASPTMNYRKLVGDRTSGLQSSIKNIPFALSIPGDVNKLVNHKPALGFEVGTSALYALGKNFSLKAGIQFNYSRYYIEAFRTSNEIATIALTDSYGFRADSISSYSSIRNFGGSATNDLENEYFQLSAPVGVEWKVLGKKRLQFHLAGTVQPTYLLNKNSYMITTDMKNYTVAPSLVRRWNVNTTAEAYLSYQAAGLRWQVGPQFRYQLLSSYSSKYPISEYLMEYGIKFGISKTIR